jgi:hypothetical protein
MFPPPPDRKRGQQLTGSAVDIKTGVGKYASAHVSVVTGSDSNDLFGMVGAALSRIHGAASSEPFNNTSGHFLNANTTDGGDDVGAIKLSAAAGGISLAWSDSKNLWAEGGKIMMVANENDPNAIKIHADAAGTNQKIILINDAGTNEAAITLTATAGGVDIDAAAEKNIDISGGQVLVSSKDNAASAIALTANIGIAETIVITNTQGTDAAAISLLASAGGITIDGENAISIKENGAEVIGITDARAVNIGVTGQATTVKGTFNVDEAASFDSSLTIAGDFFVNGTTTTVSSSHMIVKDPIAAFGIASSSVSGGSATLGPVGDRGFAFPMATAYAGSPVFYWDNSGAVSSGVPQGTFRAAYAVTSGSEASITKVGALGLDVGALTTTTVVASGIIKTDDATEATSTTNGSLQTDGGLSVVKSAVIGDDLDLLSNGAIINFGAGQKFTATHANASNTLTVSSNHRLAFGDAADYISGDGTDLNIVSSGDIALNADGADITLEDGVLTFGKLSGAASATKLVVSSSTGGIVLDPNNNYISFAAVGSEVGRVVLDTAGGNGFILSSSLDKSLTLDSNMGLIKLAQGAEEGGENGVALVLAAASVQIEKPLYDPAGGHTAFKFAHNDTFANQFLQVSGSLRFFEENKGDNYIELRAPASVTANVTLTFPDGNGDANDVLVTDGSGVLSFTSVSGLNAPNKGFRIITGSHTRLNQLPTNEMNSGDDITGMSVASSQGATLDVFVNGQLLVSGSSSEVSAGSRDYSIQSAALTFAFDLENDDILQVVKR